MSRAPDNSSGLEISTDDEGRRMRSRKERISSNTTDSIGSALEPEMFHLEMSGDLRELDRSKNVAPSHNKSSSGKPASSTRAGSKDNGKEPIARKQAATSLLSRTTLESSDEGSYEYEVYPLRKSRNVAQQDPSKKVGFSHAVPTLSTSGYDASIEDAGWGSDRLQRLYLAPRTTPNPTADGNLEPELSMEISGDQRQIGPSRKTVSSDQVRSSLSRPSPPLTSTATQEGSFEPKPPGEVPSELSKQARSQKVNSGHVGSALSGPGHDAPTKGEGQESNDTKKQDPLTKPRTKTPAELSLLFALEPKKLAANLAPLEPLERAALSEEWRRGSPPLTTKRYSTTTEEGSFEPEMLSMDTFGDLRGALNAPIRATPPNQRKSALSRPRSGDISSREVITKGTANDRQRR